MKIWKKRRDGSEAFVNEDEDPEASILADGNAVRVSLAMMDGMQRDIAESNALHKPGGGNPPAEATARREQASVEYDRRVGEAWRNGKPADAPLSNDVAAAYQEYEQSLTSAWQGGKA